MWSITYHVLKTKSNAYATDNIVTIGGYFEGYQIGAIPDEKEIKVVASNGEYTFFEGKFTPVPAPPPPPAPAPPPPPAPAPPAPAPAPARRFRAPPPPAPARRFRAPPPPAPARRFRAPAPASFTPLINNGSDGKKKNRSWADIDEKERKKEKKKKEKKKKEKKEKKKKEKKKKEKKMCRNGPNCKFVPKCKFDHVKEVQLPLQQQYQQFQYQQYQQYQQQQYEQYQYQQYPQQQYEQYQQYQQYPQFQYQQYQQYPQFQHPPQGGTSFCVSYDYVINVLKKFSNMGSDCYFDVVMCQMLIFLVEGIISINDFTNDGFRHYMESVLNEYVKYNKYFVSTHYISARRTEAANFLIDQKEIRNAVPNGQGDAVTALAWAYRQLAVNTDFITEDEEKNIFLHQNNQTWTLPNWKLGDVEKNTRLMESKIPNDEFITRKKNTNKIYTFTIQEFVGEKNNKTNKTNKIIIPKNLKNNKLTLLSCIYHTSVTYKASEGGHYAFVWCYGNNNVYIDCTKPTDKVTIHNNNNNNNNNLELAIQNITHVVVTYVRN
jgi:hypothetical protein